MGPDTLFVGRLWLIVLISALIGYFFKEISLLVTVLAIFNNVLCLAGSVYLWGIRRGKLSWAEMGLFPPRWRKNYLPIAIVLALGIIPLRSCLGWLVQLLVDGNMDSLQARTDLIFAGGFTLPSFLIILVGVGILARSLKSFIFAVCCMIGSAKGWAFRWQWLPVHCCLLWRISIR